MREPLQFWGAWDDDGPFSVLAEGRTIEQAALALADETGVTDGGRCVLIPDGGEQPRRRVVWDCEYDGPMPCKQDGCRHAHEETVYVFYLSDDARGRGQGA